MDRTIARDEIKGQLKAYVEDITEKSKGSNMYVCPLCGSGTGPHSTGAFSIKDGTSWKCFSCDEGGDIFDLIGKVEGLIDYKDQLTRAAALFNIILDDYPEDRRETPKTQKPLKNPNSNFADHQKQQPKNEPAADYTALYLEANKNITKTNYHRGISLDTLNRFNIGYVESWRHPKAPNAPATPRLIIPTSKESYLARDTRQDIPPEQQEYTKSKVGKVHLFNDGALNSPQKPIFIVEGELDALSIIDVGGKAIGLGSVANIRTLLNAIKVRKIEQPFIIALDNDNGGDKACKQLEEGLTGLNMKFYRVNPPKPYKDANEALQADREAFSKWVDQAQNIEDEIKKARKEQYLNTSAAHHLQGFIDGIVSGVDTPFIPTGFTKLDEILEGGLYEGLYIVGAISSLGKTTFINQMADQMAQAGNDILIFSLEMARTELMAKSISRHTLQLVLNNGGNTRNAKTTRGITTGKRYANYNDEEKELIKSAVRQYGNYAMNIYISEGIGDIGTEQIRRTIEQHLLFTGKTPIVIIDYIQILAPHNERASDKTNTDNAVMELKRISRDFKLPIIGISSFNRASYKEAVTMEAFKESGAIEYSSDVLIGLQLKGAGVKDFNSDEAKKKDPREVELVILKNRNGRAGDKLPYKYYPLFNYFSEE